MVDRCGRHPPKYMDDKKIDCPYKSGAVSGVVEGRSACRQPPGSGLADVPPNRSIGPIPSHGEAVNDA